MLVPIPLAESPAVSYTILKMTVVMIMLLMMIVKFTVAPTYCLIWLVIFGRSPTLFSLFTYDRPEWLTV